jgi:hypothetical protein
MILNAGNSRIMKKLTGSPYIDDWSNVPVTVFVDQNVRFGRDTVEGLRINAEKPRIQKSELLPDTPQWKNAIAAYNRDGNLDAVEKRMSVSIETRKTLIEEAKANVA